MTNALSKTAADRGLTFRMVLGLSPAGADNSGRRPGLQYDRLVVAMRLKVASHAAAAIGCVWLFRDVVALPALLMWALALGMMLAFSARHDLAIQEVQYPRHEARKRGPDISGGHNDTADLRRQVEMAALLALLWAVPVVFFALHASPLARLELWTILALLMTVSAVVIPAAPLPTLVFTAMTGLAVVLGFVLTGALTMALTAALFVTTIMLSAVAIARQFLLSRLGEAGVAERDVVVSLLLREYEDEGKADWLWETDSNRIVRGTSSRFAHALAMAPEQIDGQLFIQLLAGPAWLSGVFDPSMHELAERIKRRVRFSDLPVMVIVRGARRWWAISGAPCFDEKGSFSGFHGVGSDITQQRASSEKLAWLASYDTLTGLPNRNMLTTAAGEGMLYAAKWRTRCAFLMIDLDRFKTVNDTLGHLIGDQLLAGVASRLKSIMGETDLCGRLGGDEFGVVIRDATDLTGVNRIAQMLIDRLSEPYTIEGRVMCIGASVGVAIGPRDGDTVETLMRNADLALYRAKASGGGQYAMYEPALLAQAEERRRIELALRHALDRNEFKLAFQPVVTASDEGVVSFEALLRWQNPELGTVAPSTFIPLAEDNRLIVQIGDWVLKQACLQAMLWPPHVRVAVNVSREQLIDPNFNNSVVSALALAHLPPQRLEIEVSESIFLRDAVTARIALERVMALGCAIALDDFGTGYSSLGQIRKLRFSTIKLDRSFVKGAAIGNRESLAVIRAVVAMAESLEMATTADGVETEAELALVRSLGCQRIQGFYYGRPMSIEDTMLLFSPIEKREIGAV